MYKKTEARIMKSYNVNEDSFNILKYDNVIEVDPPYQMIFVTEIELWGEYNKRFNIIADFANMGNRSIIVDDDLLIIGATSKLVVYDLKVDKIIKNIQLDTWADDVIKLLNGYFVHGELTNFFFDKDFNLVWERGCADIFENSKVKDVVEIGKNYVAVYDWYGCKHYYNEEGEFKCTYHEEYNMG
ncbi:MAG: hypothetical protein IJ458_03070 [Clostridia bacterium]|nr:hypothetical protein [Clostridia bacterium]